MPMKMKRRSVFALALALLLTAALASCGAEARPEVGSPAPSVQLQRLEDGEMVRFPDDWSGRAVAVSFFSPG